MCIALELKVPTKRVDVYNIGVNISERKSGTERTKKRKKWELVLFVHPPGGASGTVVHSLDATRILPVLRWPGRQNTQNFTNIYMARSNFNDYVSDFAEQISFSEHWKLVTESSEFQLTLSRVHRAHFFQLEIRQKSGTF